MLAELERFYADYCSSIRREADALRGEKVPAVTEELFAIYENTGNRLKYESVYFLRRKYLAVFGLKGILDGEERDILKLEEVIRDICGEECWALPAHVNRKEDENWRNYIDLFAAETAQTLAEMGHEVEVIADPIDMGRGQIIWRTENGLLVGGTEPRCDGTIAAW